MQIDRLLNIVLLLIKGEPLTAKKLAQHFSVSTRTIYRDLDALSLAGIPITTSRGSGGGVSLLKEFTLNTTILSPQEKSNILQGLHALQAAHYPAVDSTLHKLSALFRQSEKNAWLQIDFSYWGETGYDQDKFLALKGAILEKRIIAFDYYDSRLRCKQRVAEPLCLLFRERAWYLHGFCREKRAARTFRLSRIRNVIVSKECFTRQLADYPPEEPIYANHYELYDFIMRFPAHMAHRVFDEFVDHRISVLEDKSFLVHENFPINAWVIQFLLSFGDGVEVLEPKSVRKLLHEKAKNIFDLYQE